MQPEQTARAVILRQAAVPGSLWDSRSEEGVGRAGGGSCADLGPDTEGERAQEGPVFLSVVASVGRADGRSGQSGERGPEPQPETVAAWTTV